MMTPEEVLARARQLIDQLGRESMMASVRLTPDGQLEPETCEGATAILKRSLAAQGLRLRPNAAAMFELEGLVLHCCAIEDGRRVELAEAVEPDPNFVPKALPTQDIIEAAFAKLTRCPLCASSIASIEVLESVPTQIEYANSRPVRRVRTGPNSLSLLVTCDAGHRFAVEGTRDENGTPTIGSVASQV